MVPFQPLLNSSLEQIFGEEKNLKKNNVAD